MYITPFRLYDVRLGRWNTRDPIFDPSVSPYEGMGSNPISLTDLWGLNPGGGGDKKPTDGAASKTSSQTGTGPYVPTTPPPAASSTSLALPHFFVDPSLIEAVRKASQAPDPLAEKERQREERRESERKRSPGLAVSNAARVVEPVYEVSHVPPSPYLYVFHPELRSFSPAPIPVLRRIESYDHFVDQPITVEQRYPILFKTLAVIDFVTTMGVGPAVSRRGPQTGFRPPMNYPAIRQYVPPYNVRAVVNVSVPKLNAVNTGQRVGSAAYKSLNRSDNQHYFPDVVDNYASQATRTSLLGNDGVTRDLYQIEGSLPDESGAMRSGIFEWIVEGTNVTHRRFIPGGVINGTPNQIVR